MSDDARVDDYIAAAAPFAQPILRHLRGVFHAAHPDIVEAIKWSMPMFTYRGRIVANMAAFTAHAAFGTWQRDGEGMGAARTDGMGKLGKLTRLADLPSDAVIATMVTDAIAFVDAGGAMQSRSTPKPPAETPDDLAAALAAVPDAATRFADFPPGARREYVDWVTEAKTPATRAKRIATTVEWAGEGKRRN